MGRRSLCSFCASHLQMSRDTLQAAALSHRRVLACQGAGHACQAAAPESCSGLATRRQSVALQQQICSPMQRGAGAKRCKLTGTTQESLSQASAATPSHCDELDTRQQEASAAKPQPWAGVEQASRALEKGDADVAGVHQRIVPEQVLLRTQESRMRDRACRVCCVLARRSHARLCQVALAGTPSSNSRQTSGLLGVWLAPKLAGSVEPKLQTLMTPDAPASISPSPKQASRAGPGKGAHHRFLAGHELHRDAGDQPQAGDQRGQQRRKEQHHIQRQVPVPAQPKARRGQQQSLRRMPQGLSFSGVRRLGR